MSYRKKRGHKNLNESLKESILNNIDSFEGVNSSDPILKDMMIKKWIDTLKIEIYKKTSKALKDSKKHNKYYKREIKFLKNNKIEVKK